MDQLQAQLFNRGLFDRLDAVCEKRMYKAGDVVRQLGEHYSDALFIVSGKLGVHLTEDQSSTGTQTRQSGPVGEIGFLWGTPACATITALQNTETLVLNDDALVDLRESEPDAAHRIVQALQQLAQDRLCTTLALTHCGSLAGGVKNLSVLMCRKPEQLRQAQKLRYDVYCRELGRMSPSADEVEGVIVDELDESGKTFIGIQNGEIIGTLRTNYASDGNLGELEEIYSMQHSAFHPQATAVCTKFIIKPAARGSTAALVLISALTKHLLRHDIKECFIDCIPPLLHYYRAMGFEVAGERFMHPENGLSVPLRINLHKHGAALAQSTSLRSAILFAIKAKFYKLFPRGISRFSLQLKNPPLQ